MSSQDYNKLTVAQLRSALSERGLDDKGKKSELVDRLKGNDEEKLQAEVDQEDALEVEAEELEAEEVEAEEEEADAEEEEADVEQAAAEENGDADESAMNETTDSKMEEEEGQEEEHPLDSGEFVMLDEAGDDELEDDVNEEELLGEDDIAAAEKAEEEDEEDDDGNKEEAIIIEDDDDEMTDEKKGKRSEKKGRDRRSSQEKKEEKIHVTEGGIPEEDMKVLKADFHKREAEEKAKAERINEKRYIYRIFKHVCLKFMEDGMFNKSIVIKKFKPEFFGNEALQEGVRVADIVNIHTDANKTGYCELVIRSNKLNKEIRTKVTEALPDCEVTVAAKSFFKEMVETAENRNKKAPDFTDKYRECMLLATVEITGDEQLQEMSSADIEDEVAPFFPEAVSITVPDNSDESKNFRFILVEFPSIKIAEEKLDKVREVKPTLGSKKLDFSIYQRKWLDEKFRMRREANDKKDTVRDMARAFRDSPILTEEERQTCRMRIEQVYKSLKAYKKDDLFYQILSDEKTLIREKLRQDDRKRADKKLPILQWNPDTMKEEVKEEKKKDEEKKDKDKDSKDKDKEKKDTKDNSKKNADDRRRSRSQQTGNKRQRSSSRDRSGARNVKNSRRRSRSPGRRRGGTGGRWQDNRSNQQNSIMGQPPQQNFQHMRGGGMQQQRGNPRMNTAVNNRGGRGGVQAGRGGHMGGGMGNMQMNMMNNQMMAGQPGMGMMQQQMQMQGMGSPPMMGAMGVQQAAIAANPADSSASSNPVQLLLGLSKVLSNQIKQMSATDQPAAASGRDYRDRGAASQDNFYRGGGDNRTGGRGSQGYQGSNNRSGGAGYDGGAGYYRS